MPARGDRELLTARQESIVRDALARGLTQDQAAFLAGITRRLLVTRLADQLRDCRIGQGRGPKRRGDCDPSEEEIETMKRAIRAAKGDLPSPETSPPPAAR